MVRVMVRVQGGWNLPEKVWRRAHDGEENILEHGHPVYCHGFLLDMARIS